MSASLNEKKNHFKYMTSYCTYQRDLEVYALFTVEDARYFTPKLS